MEADLFFPLLLSLLRWTSDFYVCSVWDFMLCLGVPIPGF